MTTATKKISTFALVMLIVVSIDSIRNLPATALFGDTLIFFFIFASVVFLIPAALISAELSSAWTEYGGVFDWTRMAFGNKVGFLAIWLQWINTMVWFPTILSFIAGTIAFLIDPALVENRVYLVSIILISFWAITIINLYGIKTSARFASICCVLGFIIPVLLIIGFSMTWLVMGKPIHLHFQLDTLLPKMGHSESWISLTAIMTAFLGMELATVHVRQVENPQKTFPKAMFYSVLIILITMIMGAFAIAIVIPRDQINIVDGVMQAFGVFFSGYHLKFLLPVLMIMILIGSFGEMINWVISPAKGLLRAAKYHFMPDYFAKENSYGVAAHVLIIQALLVSLICVAFLFMPTVNASYWLLTDLSTQLYMLMYLLMFVSAIRLRFKYPDQERPFAIPFGKFGTCVVGLLGLFGCVVTLIVGFFPPDSIDVGGHMHYIIAFTSGIVIMIAPVILFYIYHGVRLKRDI
ncbi:MAG: APC family permease [Gammaproteobacteria bacterium]